MNSKSNKTKEISSSFVHKDGGWGWIVILANSYNLGITVGTVSNYALLYNKMVLIYKNEENHVFYAATIGSLSLGLKLFLCLFGSFLVGYFKPRKIGIIGGLISMFSLLACAFINHIRFYIISYGICLAIGHSFLLAASMSILPHYFSKKLSLANGLTNFLSAIIIVGMPIITSLLFKSYGLKEAFILFAIMNGLSSLLCLTYKSELPEVENMTKIDKVKQSFGIEVLKNPKFVIWCVASFVGSFGFFMPIINIAHFSIIKFPGYNPAIINVTFATISGFSAMIFGKLGDITKFNRVHYHSFAHLIYGLLTIMLPFSANFYVMMLELCIMAVMDGIWLSFRGTIATDLAGSSRLSAQASGYYHFAMAPTSIIGPAVAGRLFELNKNYDFAFYLGGASCVCYSLIITIFIMIPEIYSYCAYKKNSEIN